MMSSTLMLLAGCTGHSANTYTEDDVITLPTEFSAESPSYKEYFGRVEVIPLETNDSSLLAEVSKIVVIDDRMALLDKKSNKVKIFNTDGSYAGNIGDIGQGPEEYLTVYDISYNPHKKYLTFLSPFGEIINYTLDNRLVDRIELPPKPNYWAAEWMDGEQIALWSAVDPDISGISVFEPYLGKTVMDNWYNCREFDMMSGIPFCNFNGRLYFLGPFTNDVYEITTDSLYLRYRWDFGKDNISGNYRESMRNIEDDETRYEKLNADFRKNEYKYLVWNNWVSGERHIALLLTSPYPDVQYKTAIYSKGKGKGVCFSKFREGMTFTPCYVNDEYVLCQIPETEIEVYRNVTGSDIIYNEDDNIILAKYYFKK